MIKYLELALSQEVYEYLEELDQMNLSARGNVLNQYLRNTSIGTTVINQHLNFCLAYSDLFQYIKTIPPFIISALLRQVPVQEVGKVEFE
jgi:hypothetical protein